MLWRIVGMIVGTRWRAFCGMSPERFVETATDALDHLGYEYSTNTISTTQTEQVMLGSDDVGKSIEVTTPHEFTIDVITATGNPLTRAMLGFFVTPERKEDLYAGLSMVTFSEFSAAAKPSIGAFVRVLTEKSESPPWKVDYHYHFRVAIPLRYKIRILWKYWLHVASKQRSR